MKLFIWGIIVFVIIEFAKDFLANEIYSYLGDDKKAVVLDEIEEINEKENSSIIDNLHDVDIMFKHKNKKNFNSGTVGKERKTIRDERLIWTSRDIPYRFVSNLNTSARNAIKAAMLEIQKVSCIRFHEKKPEDRPILFFIPSNGCWSYVGMVMPYLQALSIGKGCEKKEIVLHELLHALGFFHEYSRFDRDNHIGIQWQNVKPEIRKHLFTMKNSFSRNLKSDYDYESLMHLGKYSFSRNGRETIKQRSGKKNVIFGQKDGLSKGDITAIRRLYQCDQHVPTNTWTKWSEFAECFYFSEDEPCNKRRYRVCGRGKCPCSKETPGYPFCNIESVKCDLKVCKQDGNWNRWTQWSSCVGQKCKTGRRMRTRKCDDPKPHNGGKNCEGNGTEVHSCTVSCKSKCTFDENWCGYNKSGLWERYGHGAFASTEETGHNAGTQSILLSPVFPIKRTRQCFMWTYHMYGEGRAMLSAFLLQGSGKETKVWELCSKLQNTWLKAGFNINASKDANSTFQVKFVSQHDESWTGDVAVDDLFLMETPCVDGQWSNWTPWSSCPKKTCSEEKRNRTRQCNNPKPGPGGRPCEGAKIQKIPCSNSCPTNCTFNDDMCGYIVTGLWRRHRDKTPSRLTGPTGDVEGYGAYIYTEASGIPYGKLSELVSPVFEAATEPQCFSWFYHMYGRGMGEMTLYINRNGVHEKLWHQSGNHGDKWLKERLNIVSKTPFQIKFVARRGRTWQGDSALDSLYLGGASCVDGKWGAWSSWSKCMGDDCLKGKQERYRKCNDPSPKNGGLSCVGTPVQRKTCVVSCPERCTFDRDFCGYSLSSQWHRQSFDSISTNPNDMYAYSKFSRYLSTMTSPEFKTTTFGQCFSWYYRALTPGPKRLTVSILRGQKSEEKIWDNSFESINEWEKIEFNIESNSSFRIKLVSTGNIGLDNLFLSAAPCDDGPRKCTFDKDLCGYTANDLWKHVGGKVPPINKAPSRDMEGRGMYMNTDVQGDSNPAVMTSELFDAVNKPLCLSWFYHMHGSTTGTLAIHLVRDEKKDKVLWTKKGQMKHEWEKGRRSLSSDVPFRIKITAQGGKSKREDIALDDIVLSDGECVDGKWGSWSNWTICPSGDCVKIKSKRVRMCDSPRAQHGGFPCYGKGIEERVCKSPCPTNCTFNYDWCNYEHDGLWRHRKGATPSDGTGPNSDVEGNGMYVYVEAGLSPATVSQLLSPKFNATNGPKCFSWKYHMYGAGVGILRLYVRENGKDMEIWKRRGQQRNTWVRGEINVVSAGPFQMKFVSSDGISWQGDIALDNLELSDEPCGGYANTVKSNNKYKEDKCLSLTDTFKGHELEERSFH